MNRKDAHFDDEARAAAERFAPMGWALFGKWHQEWMLRAPSGHHLGAAAQWADPRSAPWTADHWTWDGPTAPLAGPWDDPSSWTAWTGSPVTPNWRFDGFYVG